MLIYPYKTEFDGTNLIIFDVFSPLILKVNPWDKNLEVEIVRMGFDPDFNPRKASLNLLDFDLDEESSNPIREFLRCIPYEVRSQNRVFKFMQIQLMQLQSTINWKEALSDENLLLLWLLVGKSAENDWDRT